MERNLNSSQKLCCTYSVTQKDYKTQFWYQCLTCTPNERGTSVCQACAAVCHYGHKLLMNYGQCYCDCGAGELKTSCVLFQQEDIAVPTVNVDYGTRKYYLKEGDPDIERVLREHKVPFYTRVGRTVYVPWIEQSVSQPVYDVVDTLSASWSRSCECEAEGNLFILSNDGKSYISMGSYQAYKNKNKNKLVAR